jgi:hypothetical protein
MILLVVVALAMTATVAYGRSQLPAEPAGATAVAETGFPLLNGQSNHPTVIFRSTAEDANYGHIGMVRADDPNGPREFSSQACDRVYAVATAVSCLKATMGVATVFEGSLVDTAGNPITSWPLAGVPSRTRISPDGSLVASTSFVAGHSYSAVGFSTETLIRSVNGGNVGNLEEFRLFINEEEVSPPDRNVWGVTFAGDDETFYATVGTGGHTWLVRGSVSARTLRTVADGVECPSLSPDGRRIGFKKNVSTGPTPSWRVAVLDLGAGTETVLPEDRSIDDQVEWLDDATLLYGVPRAGSGDADVWAAPVDGSGPARLFLDHAWSPAVVR